MSGIQELEKRTAQILAKAEKLEGILKTSQENLLHAQAVNEFKALGLPERQADLFLADGNTDISAKSVDKFLKETQVEPTVASEPEEEPEVIDGVPVLDSFSPYRPGV